MYDTHHRSQGIRGSDHHGYQINDHHSNRIKDSNPTAMAFSKVSQSSYKLKASSAIHSFHGHIILYSFPFEVAPPEFWYHFHIFLHLPCLRNILLQVMNGGGRKNSWKITGKKTGFHLCIVCIYRVYVLDSVSHSGRGNGEWFGVGLFQ